MGFMGSSGGRAGARSRGIAMPTPTMAITSHWAGMGALVLVAATALVTTGILNAAAPQQEEPDMEAIMKAYKKAATPGKPHHALMKSVGAWDVATTYYMGEKVQKAHATAEFESLFGGRFLVQRHHGNMGPDQKFEGFQIIG